MENRSIYLAKEDDLLLSIQSIAQSDNITGFVLGIVGNLSKAVFQCPGKSSTTTMEGNLEVIALNGTISPEKSHLHLSISDENCNVWGGHLEPGSLVLKGIDLLIGITENNYLSNSEKPANDKARVEIMVLPNCPWCSRIIRILNSKKIPYHKTIITNDNLFDMAKAKSGSSIFPQVYIDGNYIGGYEDFSKTLNNSNLQLV